MLKTLAFAAQIGAILAVASTHTHAGDVITDLTPWAEAGDSFPSGYAEVDIDPDILPITEVDEDQLYCLAEALYFEARNQTHIATVAVGNVIMNRVQSPDFPDTICGVVHQGPLDGSAITRHRCQFSYYCDGKSDVAPVNDTPGEVRAWQGSQLIAELIYRGLTLDVTNGSTYYHADYVDPFWNDVYELVALHGSHLFYKHY